MKLVRRVVAWLIIVCVFLHLPLITRAEEPAEDYDTLFEQANQNEANHQEVIRAFFTNPGHLMRALAYHTGNARSNIRSAINQHMTDSQEKAAYYLIALLNTAPYEESLSQSEEALITYYLMEREDTRLRSMHTQIMHWPDFAAEILEQMKSDRAAAADRLAAAIHLQFLDVVWNLVEEPPQVQEQFISLLEDIDDYYTQLCVIRSLYYLIHSEIGGELPEYPEYSFWPGTTTEHVELILAMLDKLPDIPWPVVSHEPFPEELEKWLAAPEYPDMDINYPALIAGMAESQGVSAETQKTLINAALLDTEDFIRALTQEESAVQQMVLQCVANENTSHDTVNALSEVYKIYAQETTFRDSEKQLIVKAQQHFAKLFMLTYRSDRSFAELVEDLRSFAYSTVADIGYPMAAMICEDPLQFAEAMVAVDANYHKRINSALKSGLNEEDRQVIVNVVYDYLQSTQPPEDGTSTDTLMRDVLYAFLEYQGKSPQAVYPYGVNPNPTQPTEPSDTTTGPTGPLFMTEPVTNPTQKPTDPMEPTQDTAPTAEEEPEQTPPEDTSWISTVCIILGLLCISIAVGSTLAKKKKAPEEPLPEAAVQPKVPPVVQVHCPAPLDKPVQLQITAALQQRYDAYSVHWYSEKNTHGICRCYGSDGDCHILFYAGGFRPEEKTCRTVGGQTFCFPTGFELYAYKDGQLVDLDIALEQGLVSREAIQKALAQHEKLEG